MIQFYRKMNPRKKIIAGVYLLAIILVMMNYVILPQKKKMDLARQQIQTLRAEIQSHKAMLDEMKTRQLASISLETGKDPRVSANSSFSNFVLKLNDSAQPDGLQIQRISLENRADQKGYARLSYALQVRGDFMTLAHFLEDIEGSLFLAEIRAVEVTRISSDLRECIAKVKIDHYAFVEN